MTEKMRVLYPFMEDGFNEHTAEFVEQLDWLRANSGIEMLITVDRAGKTADLLKKRKLRYEEVPFASPVKPDNFYPTALFKLIRSSMPLFFYFRANPVHLVHCPDLVSLLCWGNTARMNRAKFIASLQTPVRLSHYARLMVNDAAKLICRDEDVRAKIPLSYPSILDLTATERFADANEKRRESIRFWSDLYVSLFIKPDSVRTTGLLN